MTDVETLAERVSTVERAVTDGECEFPEATELSEVERRLAAVEERLDELTARADELDAATQAVRGYVGNVRSVNEDVEQRADTALAATERLERRLDEMDAHRQSEAPQRSSESGVAQPDRETHRAAEPTGHRVDREPVGDGFGPSESDTGPETDTDPDTGVVERIRSLL